MGELRRQNEALLSIMIHEVLLKINQDWSLDPNESNKSTLKEFALALLIGYSTALHREEITLVSLQEMLETWEESTIATPDPYIMVTLH